MRTHLPHVLLTGIAFASTACRSVPGKSAIGDLCGTRPGQLCSADGVVSIIAVDDRRILVALDARDANRPDGFVDQLFLYTATENHGYRPQANSFSGHVEYGQGFLRVIDKEEQLALVFVVPGAAREDEVGTDVRVGERFDHSTGLSHYSGLNGLRLARLKAVRRSIVCDGPVGSCVEVDGFRIGFPA